MKTFMRIQVPSVSLPLSLSSSRGRLPNPLGSAIGPFAASRMIEETITGGAITLELDSVHKLWRIAPPAYAHWPYYLPATQGKWARSGSEITIGNAAHQQSYVSLRQANKMSGQAVLPFASTDGCEFRTEWRRIAKPLPTSGQPPIWYGLAIAEGGGVGAKRGKVVVFSADRWFRFLISPPTEGAFRGYFPEAAFVLLTGYKDQNDLAFHRGAAVDYELSLGDHWNEQVGALKQMRELMHDDLLPLVLRKTELLRALAMAALQETCVDYDERHVIIGDLSAAGMRSGLAAHTGECKVLDGGR